MSFKVVVKAICNIPSFASFVAVAATFVAYHQAADHQARPAPLADHPARRGQRAARPARHRAADRASSFVAAVVAAASAASCQVRRAGRREKQPPAAPAIRRRRAGRREMSHQVLRLASARLVDPVRRMIPLKSGRRVLLAGRRRGMADHRRRHSDRRRGQVVDRHQIVVVVALAGRHEIRPEGAE
jgi:hypothetical protein